MEDFDEFTEIDLSLEDNAELNINNNLIPLAYKECSEFGAEVDQVVAMSNSLTGATESHPKKNSCIADPSNDSESDSVSQGAVEDSEDGADDHDDSNSFKELEIEAGVLSCNSDEDELMAPEDEHSDFSITDSIIVEACDLEIDFTFIGRWTHCDGAARPFPFNTTSERQYSDGEEERPRNLRDMHAESQRIIRETAVELPKYEPPQYSSLSEFRAALKTSRTDRAKSPTPPQIPRPSSLLLQLRSRVDLTMRPTLSGKDSGFVSLEGGDVDELQDRFHSHLIPEPQSQPSQVCRKTWLKHREELKQVMRMKRLEQHEKRLEEERRARDDSNWTVDKASVQPTLCATANEDDDDEDYEASSESESSDETETENESQSEQDVSVQPYDLQRLPSEADLFTSQSLNDVSLGTNLTANLSESCALELAQPQPSSFIDASKRPDSPQASNSTMLLTQYVPSSMKEHSQRRSLFADPVDATQARVLLDSMEEHSQRRNLFAGDQETSQASDSTTLLTQEEPISLEAHSQRRTLFAEQEDAQLESSTQMLHSQRRLMFDEEASDASDASSSSESEVELVPEELHEDKRNFVNEEEEEELEDEEEEVEEDDEEEQLRRKVTGQPKLRLNRFLEEEAELSGSDEERARYADDDEEAIDMDEAGREYEQLHREFLTEEAGMSERNLRAQLERMHHRHELDDDQRKLRLLKEMFFEDGDLHDEENRVRQRRFRWLGLDKDFTVDLDDAEDGVSEPEEEEASGRVGSLLTSAALVDENSSPAKPQSMLMKLAHKLVLKKGDAKMTFNKVSSTQSNQTKTDLANKRGSLLTAKPQTKSASEVNVEHLRPSGVAKHLGLRSKVGLSCYVSEREEDHATVDTLSVGKSAHKAFKRPLPGHLTQPPSKKRASLVKRSVFAALK